MNYTLGITELSKDEFAVTGGKIYNDSAVPGSSGIFNFSMGGEVVRTDFAFTEPELPVIAGMTALPSAPKTIMAAAPFNGSVVRIDILTGKMDIIIKDKQLEPTKWAKTGVCAVKVGDDGYLYYAVQSQGTFGRVKITEKGDKAGDLESINISSNPGPEGGYMAFALDGKGHAYAVERPNKLMKIDIKGRKQKTLIKGDDLKNPSAVVISKDGKKLYITTIGDYATSAGGKIVEVDI